MVNIVQSTIRANVFETVYDLLTAQLSEGTVTAAFIDDNPTFPQVVINPSSIKIKRTTLTNENRSYEGMVEVELYCKKNKEIDQISDEISNALYTNESTLAGFGLYLDDISDSNETTSFWNDQKIHIKFITIEFKANV
jgi:serine protease inhibitor ecotin